MNQKGFANIVLIVLVVILAGALGYVTLVRKPAPVEQPQTNNLPNTQTTTPPLPNNTVSQTLPTANSTAGWKTYQNTKFNFKINYPNNLVPTESIDCNITTEKECSVRFFARDVSKTQFSIIAFLRPADLSLERAAELLLFYFPKKDYTLQSSIVSSQRAVYVDIVDEQQRPNESGRVYFLKKDDDLISIFFPIGFNYSSILSSFTFIN